MAAWDRILVSIPPDLMARLEEWEDDQPVPPSRSSVLRTALDEWLVEQEEDREDSDGE